MLKLDNIVGRLFRKIVLPVLFVSGLASAQNYTLQGKITSLKDSTGVPIENVKLYVDSSAITAETDVNGNYSIAGIQSGTHNVRISKKGYMDFFETAVNITSNKTLNFTLPETTQTVTKGTGIITAEKMIDLYSSSAPKNKDPLFADYPKKTFLSNATSYDSLIFRKALGNGLTQWQDSDTSSIEFILKEKRYILTTDSADVVDNGGVLITFNSPYNNQTTIFDDGNGLINIISANVSPGPTIPILQHEVAGFGDDKSYVTTFSSNMDPNGHPPEFTLDDNILTKTAERHHKAKVRGEQNAFLLNIEDYVSPTIPSSVSITQPVNNSTGVPLEMLVKWTNSFGTETYHLQISTDSSFTTFSVNDSLLRRTDKNFTASPNTKYFVRVRAKNEAGVSEWSNTTNSTPLPVELVSFIGSYIDNIARLKWTTATEVNNYGFDVEKNVDRKIKDWKRVGFVQGSGSSSVSRTYEFVETNISDTVEYRLKQIDNDGQFKYSNNIELILKNNTKSFELSQNSPNPFNPTTNVRYSLKQNAHVTLGLYNTLGQLVREVDKGIQNSGMYTEQVDGNGLSSGVYLLRMIANPTTGTEKPYMKTIKMILKK
jgi:hypothetical protein